jgi:peptidoglycan/LPS O-acetylase OafA/YrhL
VPFVGRAYLAVDLFFLLSGFVMAHVYGRLLTSDRRAHWLLFARARFARIYPLFALTTLAMFAIAAVSHTHGCRFQVVRWHSSLFCYNNGLPA